LIDQSLAHAVTSFSRGLDHARELFLAILGHDLRSPLAAIRIASEVMTEARDIPQSHAALASNIGSSVDVMSRLLESLLDFAASGLGGRLPIEPRSLDLDGVCRSVVNEVRAANPACDITYTFEGDAKGEWDAERIRQVISNLTNNAVRHGGQPCRIAVRLAGTPEQVALSVHNMGVPIPPSMLSNIFEPLRRPLDHNPAQQPRRSIGLGLYIARQVVLSHDGSIEVTSTAEAGTTFTVHLPRKAKAVRSPAP
jgi:signal transduction histidine kinase